MSLPPSGASTSAEANTGLSTAPTADALSVILDEMKRSERRMEDRLKQMEEQMHASQEEAVQKAAKKAKREKAYSFKKKGHQEQNDFNERVWVCLEEARDEISKRPLEQSALDKAKRAVDEGLRLISERQKLVKIADRSEYGWGVVAEYQADKLASGSDDERKFEKAERATEKKW